MTVLTHSQIIRLPKVTSDETHRRELAMEYCKELHADAGSKKSRAWDEYIAAVDNCESRAVIDELYRIACEKEEICQGAWGEYEEAKRSLLALFS